MYDIIKVIGVNPLGLIYIPSRLTGRRRKGADPLSFSSHLIDQKGLICFFFARFVSFLNILT